MRAGMRTAFFALSAAVASGASCSVFELGDVLSGADASTSNDATIGDDGSPSDAQAADDFGPCVEGGNPCSCPPEAIVKTATGTGILLIVDGPTVYFMTKPASGFAFTVYASPVDANPSVTPRFVASSTASVGTTMALGANTLFFRRLTTPFGVLMADPSDSDGAPPTPYFSPLIEEYGPMTVTSTRLLFSGPSSKVCSIPLTSPPSPTGVECGGQLAIPAREGGAAYPAITADDTDVFYSQSTHIYRGDLADGGLSVVLVASSSVQNLTENGGRLFWMNDVDGGTISSVANGGGASTPLVSSRGIVSNSSALAVDDTGIYWTENGSANNADVWTAARDGTGPHRLICDFTENAAFLATDASFVYVLSNAGNVYRVPKQ
jgi:hypothetical protein